ncbi:DUF2946 domain-containing protein [Caballeronia sp. GAFFF1]|uniref:DUF2946 domain-containing protein n=1 Tax=Caballeronia sp. GAFFF1 TaxID=2921779 RepID=UPI002028FB22|nr:DUF2946 domain-containing protein [Caballeronia sp. GAFFF1]
MRKIGGIAAVWAMLLLSLAPVVSQTLKAEPFEALLASICASRIDTPDIHPAHRAGHSVVGALDACGYCGFVGHAPAPPSFVRATAFANFRRDAFSVADTDSASPLRRFANAQPRAPPSIG